VRPARRLCVPGVLLFLAAVALASCNQAEAIRAQALEESTAVTFDSTDGVQLAGRLFGPEHPRTGVVLAHMLPTDQSSWFEFADMLAGNGYGVLTFDFRGYCPGGDAGCSQGSKDDSGIWQDAGPTRSRWSVRAWAERLRWSLRARRGPASRPSSR
jgi:hypothetical protein